ncbi:aminotransferase [Reticulibacter mediterranei]|uniref:Aminotransferase n=1 Tax=Reticulibacter mediterranei TaxID=2778369 RepID=A0A8J3N7S6_9CHLR|nr:aminotransferase class I/II-fold pyridoxal phosphate-dependent enzyme [Reticulibacter mediterranei]GHO97472.1 aminotransferase [Reticulibacter mediterranei]
MTSRAWQIEVSPIQELTMQARSMKDVVSFGWGVPSFVTPLHIREAVQKALFEDAEAGIYSPVQGLFELREAIAAKHAQQEGVALDPQREIVVTVGAMEGLFAILMALVNPGDEVILTSPGFGPHATQVLLAGGTPRYVKLLEADMWKLDVDQIEHVINSRTKAIVLANPLNPTGCILKEATLRAIAELSLKYGFYIIMDETYRFITYDDKAVFNLFLIPEIRKKMIVCYSFSKEYAMTGWRVGYLLAQTELVQQVVKIHDAMVVSTPRISQIAALAALQGPQHCVTFFKNEFGKRRDLVCKRLDNLNKFFSYCRPEGTFYIFPRLQLFDIDAMQFALELLHEAQVCVIPGCAFGPDENLHIRLSFSIGLEDIQIGFDRIERFVSLYG